MSQIATTEAEEEEEEEEEEPCIGYMFDSAASTEFVRFACESQEAGLVEVEYAATTEQCAGTAHISGFSAWPASEQLSRYLASSEDLRGAAVVELGCGIGLVGLVCAELGAWSVRFTDRDPGVLRLVEASLQRLNPPRRDRLTCERLLWSLKKKQQEKSTRRVVVVAADVIYDVGVVGPVVATAASFLTPGSCFYLAASFELGDSLRELEECSKREGLVLELLNNDDGGPAATLWRLSQQRLTLSDVISQHGTAFELRPARFLCCWSGAVALAFQGWPTSVVRLKAALVVNDLGEDALPKEENPGSKWPKVTIGARRSDAPLTQRQYAALDAALRLIELPGSWRVSMAAMTLYASASHRRLISKQPFDLPTTVQNSEVDHPLSAKFVENVLRETEDTEAYLEAFNREGSVGRYTDIKPGASLAAFVHENDGGALLAAIDHARRLLDKAAPPGYFQWFDDKALHLTIRSLL